MKKKNLVIVESPAKAKTILQYLGDNYLIKASMGHVRDLPKRTLGIDVEKQFTPSYQVLKDKKKLVTELKSLAKKSEAVFIATDPDREGEAIAWHIQEALGLPESDVHRIVFNEITKTAVQNAIQNSRTINHNLVNAQQARRVLDRLIGYKLSPILSKKIRRGLSAGRVQSVAVKLICDREKLIQAFVPEEYWVIQAQLTTKEGPLTVTLCATETPTNKYTVHDENTAQTVTAALEKSTYHIQNIKQTDVSRNPAAPFITSTLQQEASRKLNWTTKKTMMVAQQLYESGLITYMRTDSFRISDDAAAAAKTYINDSFGKNYLATVKKAAKQVKGAQDAHEAIRPSYVDKTPQALKCELGADEQKLYTLIWNRFIASQMAQAKFKATQIMVSTDKDTPPYFLKATGSIMSFDGFMRVYLEGKDHEDEDPEKTLPPITEKSDLALKAVASAQKFTQPPHRYSEATLIKEMEERGIGRPSTYSPTISTVLDRGYVEKDKKQLIPTALGQLTDEKLGEFFSEIIDIDFTAEMEKQLDDIMEAKYVWQDVVAKIYSPLVVSLKRADAEMEKVNTDKPTDEICDKCQSPMIIKEGRFGAFMACSGYPECKNTKSMTKPLDVNCPKCNSALIAKRTKKGKVFYGCQGYPACDFALWDEPIPEPCPTCQHPFLIKKTKGRQETVLCPGCNAPVDR
jgi:DNA topoisomerase I